MTDLINDDKGLVEQFAGHTPGPWHYRPNECDDWGCVRATPQNGELGWIICHARDPEIWEKADLDEHRLAKTDPWEANARLIAEAPNLLARIQVLSDRIAVLEGLSEVLACSRGGGVHFAVEPEPSSVDAWFAKRNEAHAMSSLLCAIHPVDEEGCFVHKRPISEERLVELIALANKYRKERATPQESSSNAE